LERCCSLLLLIAVSPERAWRSQAPLKEKRFAFDRSAAGGCQAPRRGSPGRLSSWPTPWPVTAGRLANGRCVAREFGREER
jgi:hypothetical protein